MERDISWSAVLPGHGADVALTLSRAEAWFSLAVIVGATFLATATFGGAIWFAANTI